MLSMLSVAMRASSTADLHVRQPQAYKLAGREAFSGRKRKASQHDTMFTSQEQLPEADWTFGPHSSWCGHATQRPATIRSSLLW